MIGHLLLAKIAANPTETAWSQAYSTLNLYIVLEVHTKDGEIEHIGTIGKKLLERLQREYFALDEKTLTTIKQAVENSLSELSDNVTGSIVLATITDNTCYIAIANSGNVFLKRGEGIGTIAQAEPASVHGFSGRLEHNDILILQTHAFKEKISQQTLQTELAGAQITDTAESLAPLIHSDASGQEAAILIHYLNPQEQAGGPTTQSLSAIIDQEVLEEEAVEPEMSPLEPRMGDSTHRTRFTMPDLRSLIKLPAKKTLFIGALVILLAALSISLYSERKSSVQVRDQNRLEQFLPKTLQKIEESEALVSVNKGIALENFRQSKEAILKEQKTVASDSKEAKELQTLLARVNKNIDALAGNIAVKNKKELFSVAKVKDFSEIGALTAKGGSIILTDSTKGTLYIVKDSKSVSTDVKTPLSVTADDAHIFLVGESLIARVDKNTEKAESGELGSTKVSSIDTFNGNMYVLATDKNDILKLFEPTNSGSSYFKEKPTGAIQAFAIDGSVWLAEDHGALEKYTKGLKDSIPFSGMPDGISNNLALYTEEGFSNLYLLDKTSKKLLVIKKTGQYQNQYNLSEFDTVVGIAIDEKNNTGYLATKTTLFSFDL